MIVASLFYYNMQLLRRIVVALLRRCVIAYLIKQYEVYIYWQLKGSNRDKMFIIYSWMCADE